MPLTVLAFLAAGLLVPAAAAPAAKGDLAVSAGDVTDRRRNDNLFASLEIELRLTGEAAAGARGARAIVEKAVDDTGRNLIKEKSDGSNDFARSTGDGPPALKIELRNPARRATKVRELTGQVELFVPERDPSAQARVAKFATQMDRPISAPALKSAGAVVTVVSRKTYEEEKKKDAERRKKEAEGAGIAGAMANAFAGLFEGLFGDIGENDVLVKVEDKGKKVFSVDVLDAAGKPVEGTGSMRVGDFWILKFMEKLPADAGLQVSVMTPKAMVTERFALKDVALP